MRLLKLSDSEFVPEWMIASVRIEAGAANYVLRDGREIPSAGQMWVGLEYVQRLAAEAADE